jgi:hypothetical protein
LVGELSVVTLREEELETALEGEVELKLLGNGAPALVVLLEAEDVDEVVEGPLGTRTELALEKEVPDEFDGWRRAIVFMRRASSLFAWSSTSPILVMEQGEDCMSEGSYGA